MSLMLPDSGLIFWMTIIFLIVLFILAKFGFPVITGMVEKRNQRINSAIASAAEAEKMLAHLTEEQQRIVDEAKQKQSEILLEANRQKEQIIKTAQDEASAEAKKIFEQAQENIRKEKEEAIKSAMNEISRLSVAVAQKVVEKDLSSDGAQEEFARKMMDEIR